MKIQTLGEHVVDDNSGSSEQTAKRHGTSRVSINKWIKEGALVIDGQIFVKARRKVRSKV